MSTRRAARGVSCRFARIVVCDPFGRHGVPYQQGRPGQSPVTLAMTEGQTSTIGVAGIPLNRDEVTVVYAPIKGVTRTSPTSSGGIG
jgi:hypothetical protein